MDLQKIRKTTRAGHGNIPITGPEVPWLLVKVVNVNGYVIIGDSGEVLDQKNCFPTRIIPSKFALVKKSFQNLENRRIPKSEKG